MYRLAWTLIMIMLLCQAKCLQAAIITLDFDDLSPQTYVPDNYMGITFDLGLLGYDNHTGRAMVISSAEGGLPATPPNCVMNEWGVRQLGFTASSKYFNFIGAVFSRYGTLPSQQAPLVGFVGYRDGKQVAQTPGYQITYKPGFAPVFFTNVDYVLIVAANGPVGDAGWYCLDNLMYEPVPEPSTIWIITSGMCCLAVAGRRRSTPRSTALNSRL